MGVVTFVASVLVGLAFVIAGASKLAAGPAWPEQAAGMGAPVWTVRAIPWFELVLGALLVAQLLEPVPAILACLLLLAFTGLIAKRLSEGRRPPCACFGAWSARPIGAGHLVRNVVLLMLAFIALYG